MRPITLLALIVSLVLPAEISAQATNSLRPIESSNFPFVAGLARNSLLSTVQNSNAQIAVNQSTHACQCAAQLMEQNA